MFEGLILFGESIARFSTPEIIFYALLSSLVGVIMGALPGLTATMALALMTTLTLKLPPNQALLILICTYVGSIYGGSRSAILLNIPGTPASAASCLDGYALARQGMAGRAMGIATTGSVLGTLIGMFFLAGLCLKRTIDFWHGVVSRAQRIRVAESLRPPCWMARLLTL